MTQLLITLWCLILLCYGAQRHDARALLLRGRGWQKVEARWYGRRWAVQFRVARVV
jgi:hypothetical protein